MFLGLIKDERFIPTEYVEVIENIDFKKYYDLGARVILTDLDNTFISYKEDMPKEEQYHLAKVLHDMGFIVIIVSNNSHKKRVERFARLLGFGYVIRAMKPLKCGYKKALRMLSEKYSPNQVLAIGDQLMTDIFSANRMGFNSVMVKAIDKGRIPWTTRINLMWEKHVLKSLRKKHPEEFNRTLKEYAEADYGI